MATCRYCGKGGIFRSVDHNGLCASCQGPVALSVRSHLRVLEESLKLVQTSRNLSTRIGRWDTILEHAGHLLEFEQKGIPTLSVKPSELIEMARRERADAMVQGVTEEMEAAESKVELATTPAARLNAIAKVIHEIEDFRRRYGDDTGATAALARLEDGARERYRRVQLDNAIEVAQKAEFKGQLTKAIDGYREALYLLTHDRVPDGQQRAEIEDLEGRVARLEARSGGSRK